MSTRRLRKDSTRARVLATARELFDTLGYEATTVREIARLAGVSVGTVFTAFPSKSEILSQVMGDRHDELCGELDRMAPRLRGSTADRLRSLFAIHYGFERGRIRLFLAHIAAAFDRTASPSAKPFGRSPQLAQIIAHCLHEGTERGDVDPRVDIPEVVDLLMAAYAWTYRLAAWDGAEAEALSATMDRQIGLIAAGFAPR